MPSAHLSDSCREARASRMKIIAGDELNLTITINLNSLPKIVKEKSRMKERKRKDNNSKVEKKVSPPLPACSRPLTARTALRLRDPTTLQATPRPLWWELPLCAAGKPMPAGPTAHAPARPPAPPAPQHSSPAFFHMCLCLVCRRTRSPA